MGFSDIDVSFERSEKNRLSLRAAFRLRFVGFDSIPPQAADFQDCYVGADRCRVTEGEVLTNTPPGVGLLSGIHSNRPSRISGCARVVRRK